jgi:uncharacterized DUF497 family protein
LNGTSKKNQANIKKHGLDFGDAYQVFEYPTMLVNLDDCEDYGEERWTGIGLMGTRVVVIVFSEGDKDTIRVISFRKAISSERKRYEQAYQNEFGTP